MSTAAQPDDKVRLLIRSLRGQRVILDFDLAALYGVPTKQFNQAFKRNRDRFPPDFAFQLTATEFTALRSQIAISKREDADGEELEPNSPQSVTSSAQPTDGRAIAPNSSQSAMNSRKHRGATYRPWAFTEHGALMAANILRSARARQMSIFVLRAFVRMREELATNTVILKRLAKIDRTLLVHDSALRDVYQRLRPLLAGIFHTPRSNMTTVCPSPRPVIWSIRPIPAKGKTAPTKGPGPAAAREKHLSVHANSGEGGLVSFRLGGFAFSPHCPGAHGPMRWVRLLTANERIPSVKNAG